VGVPLPFIFGSSGLSRWLMRISEGLVRLRPTLFGFQILVRAKARPNVDTLLQHANEAAVEKREAALQQVHFAA
jgi:hypothetical protein